MQNGRDSPQLRGVNNHRSRLCAPRRLGLPPEQPSDDGAEELPRRAVAVVERGRHLPGSHSPDGRRDIEPAIQPANIGATPTEEQILDPVSCVKVVVAGPTKDAIMTLTGPEDITARPPNQEVFPAVGDELIDTGAADKAIAPATAAPTKQIAPCSTDKEVVASQAVEGISPPIAVELVSSIRCDHVFNANERLGSLPSRRAKTNVNDDSSLPDAEGDTVVSRAAVDEVVAASRNDGVVLAACVDRVFPATATNPVVVGTSRQAVGPGTAPEA